MPLHRLFLLGALAALLWFGSPGLTEDLREEALKGWDLTAADAAEGERRLAANPDDLNARAQLLVCWTGSSSWKQAWFLISVATCSSDRPGREAYRWVAGSGAAGLCASQVAQCHYADVAGCVQTLIVRDEGFATVDQGRCDVERIHGTQAQIGSKPNGALNHSLVNRRQGDPRRALHEFEIACDELTSPLSNGARKDFEKHQFAGNDADVSPVNLGSQVGHELPIRHDPLQKVDVEVGVEVGAVPERDAGWCHSARPAAISASISATES